MRERLVRIDLWCGIYYTRLTVFIYRNVKGNLYIYDYNNIIFSADCPKKGTCKHSLCMCIPYRTQPIVDHLPYYLRTKLIANNNIMQSVL